MLAQESWTQILAPKFIFFLLLSSFLLPFLFNFLSSKVAAMISFFFSLLLLLEDILALSFFLLIVTILLLTKKKKKEKKKKLLCWNKIMHMDRVVPPRRFLINILKADYNQWWIQNRNSSFLCHPPFLFQPMNPYVFKQAIRIDTILTACPNLTDLEIFDLGARIDFGHEGAFSS